MRPRVPTSPSRRAFTSSIGRVGAVLLAWLLVVSLAVPLAGPVGAAGPSSGPAASPTGRFPKALDGSVPVAGTGGGARALGAKLAPGVTRGVSTSVATRLRQDTTYPTSVDLSQWAPPVGNQGPVGSCGSWSSGYYYRYWLRDHGTGETATFAPMYLYAQIAQGQDRGSSYPGNFGIMELQGIAHRSDYAQGDYDYTSQPTSAERTAAAPYKTLGHSLLFSGAGGGDYRSAVQAVISGGSPVLLVIPIYPNFNSASYTNPYVDVPAAGTTSRGLHGVFAPMYDAWGVWIENSWGGGFARNGWVEISWAFLNQYALEGWSMTDSAAPSWSVALSASATNVVLGTPVTLTATASRDVGPTEYAVVIRRSDGLIVTTCGSGTTCAASVSSSTATSRTYTALVAHSDGSSAQATADPVTVTWSGPENDTMGTATVVRDYPYHASQDTSGATDDDWSSGACDSDRASVWYEVTAPDDGSFTVSTGGSGYDTVLDAFREDGSGGYHPWPCVDETGSGGAEAMNLGAYAGETVWIEIGGHQGDSGALRLSIGFTVDTTPPTITRAPYPAGVVPSTLGKGSTLLRWSGTDGSGSGLWYYDLQQSRDGGAWTDVAVNGWERQAMSLSLGHAYRFRARATDNAYNTGPWSTGPTFTPQIRDDTSATVRYTTGTWHRQTTASASGGATHWSTSTGARAGTTFTGRAIAWVTATGSSRGNVKVYIDGVYRTTVNCRSSSATWKRVLFSTSWTTSASHTIELRNTSAGARLDLDAFVIYR